MAENEPAPTAEAGPPAGSPRREQAERVVEAALSVGSVAAMSGSLLGEVGTYLPGGRVAGVRLLDPGAAVHVVVHHGEPLTQVAGAVRRAVGPLTGEPVHVTIEDVLGPGEAAADPVRDPGEQG